MIRSAVTGLLPACLLLAAGCSQPTGPEARARLSSYLLSRTPQLAALAPAPDRPDVRTDVPTQPTWLAMAQQLTQADVTGDAADSDIGSDGTGPAQGVETPYVPWPQRRGPAYPGDFWHSFGRDGKEMPATLWDDTKATATNPVAWIGFAAAAAGITLDATNVNGRVAEHYKKNGQLPDFLEQLGDVGGNPGVHFAIGGAMYFASLARDDVKTYEVSKTLLNALSINGLVTTALKGMASSQSPNGERHGWPSGHTSSTFCLATVLHEAYGPWVGVPMFVFASFVGYERIDARNHDFNDVISGALIGIAVGHAVSRNHQTRILGMEVLPFANPRTGAGRLALTKSW